MKNKVLSGILFTMATGISLNFLCIDRAYASSHCETPLINQQPSTDQHDLYSFEFTNQVVPSGSLIGIFELPKGDSNGSEATSLCILEGPDPNFVGPYEDFQENSFNVINGEIVSGNLLATNGGSGNSNLFINYLGDGMGLAGITEGGIVGAPTDITFNLIVPENPNEPITIDFGEGINVGEFTIESLDFGFGIEFIDPITKTFNEEITEITETPIFTARSLIDLELSPEEKIKLKISGETVVNFINLNVDDLVVEGALNDNEGNKLGSVFFSSGSIESGSSIEWEMEEILEFPDEISSSDEFSLEIEVGVDTETIDRFAEAILSLNSIFEITATPFTEPDSEPTTTPEPSGLIAILVASGINLLIRPK